MNQGGSLVARFICFILKMKEVLVRLFRKPSTLEGRIECIEHWKLLCNCIDSEDADVLVALGDDLLQSPLIQFESQDDMEERSILLQKIRYTYCWVKDFTGKKARLN